MYRKAYGSWVREGFDAWSLGIEASAVVGLRLAKLAAGGDAASKEAELMVSEKVSAGLELQAAMLAAPLGTTALTSTRKALSHYRRKVAANRRRLAR